jgi:hypothetical protein
VVVQQGHEHAGHEDDGDSRWDPAAEETRIRPPAPATEQDDHDEEPGEGGIRGVAGRKRLTFPVQDVHTGVWGRPAQAELDPVSDEEDGRQARPNRDQYSNAALLPGHPRAHCNQDGQGEEPLAADTRHHDE